MPLQKLPKRTLVGPYEKPRISHWVVYNKNGKVRCEWKNINTGFTGNGEWMENHSSVIAAVKFGNQDYGLRF